VTVRQLTAAVLDARFLAWTALWSAVALVGIGLATAIIPNPIFGREIPPEPFAIWTWVASAPLLGLVTATYTAPVPRLPVGELAAAAVEPPEQGRVLGMAAGIGAFLAVGCPVCNKVVLVLLGTSGAMTVWAPLQPLVAAASLALLVVAAVWRLRVRARGGACAS
jgi:hypothetical protein